MPNTSIRVRLSTQDEQLALALDFASDFNRLGDKVQDLFVHWLAVARNEKKVERGPVGLAYKQHWRDSPTDAANGAGAVGRQLARIHHSQETFAVHNLADERLLTKTDRGWRQPPYLLRGGEGVGSAEESSATSIIVCPPR